MPFTADISARVWAMPGRGARLIVDLDAIAGNVAAIRSAVGPRVQVLAVVKAGGYGEGARHAAMAALDGGATWLGTATVREAVELRRSGISSPILVLGPTMATEVAASIADGIALTIGSGDQLAAFCRLANAAGTGPLVVFLKIDTGMHRFGIPPEDAVAAAAAIANQSSLRLAGVFTHFASADAPDMSHTVRQVSIFRETLAAIRQAGIDTGIVHASNSAATLRRRDLDFDMVRPGICIYGVRPRFDISLLDGMTLAVRLEAAVQRVQTIPKGDTVGYGGTYAAPHPVRLGLLSLGYADGYRRMLSGRSWVGFSGARFHEVGTISMDQTVIELPEGSGAGYGTIVVVAGDGTSGEPTFEELAAMSGTIPYEILTGLGQRLPVYYVRDGYVVACNNILETTE